MRDDLFLGDSTGLQYKRLDWIGDILQSERAKRLEGKVGPPPHMITHRSRHADGARETLRLKSDRNIDRIAVQVGALGNCIADVDTDAEAEIGRASCRES